MSTWRDIWRYGVIANRIYAENEEKGKLAFEKLCEVYDKPDKDGKKRQDGMIRYILGEANEYKFKQTHAISYKENALKLYKEAEDMFPVDHWKNVARRTYERLNTGTSPEIFFNVKEMSSDENNSLTDDSIQFENLLWYGFQKTYDFVYLSDFARYVCLSALSRGTSEWPLSLVDFRTVLELEIKQCFPYIIDEFDEINKYSLFKTIQKLSSYGLITSGKEEAFTNIRMAGNIAAHELYADEKYKKENAKQFIKVLEFFNKYRQSHSVEEKNTRKYPLCQITLEELLDYLDKEKETLEKKNYYV